MKVIVTGAGSSFGRALLPVLCADARIEHVTAIDAEDRIPTHDKIRTALVGDPAGSGGGAALVGHDAIIHLSSSETSDASASAEASFERDVGRPHKLLHAAREAGIRRFVLMSSAFVYGPAVHAGEQAPLKPLRSLTFAQHLARLEHLVAIDFPECVRMRPHIVAGPNAHPMVKRLLRIPVHVRQATGAEALMQCVHEDDLAHAVLLCLNSDARGAFNFAVEDGFSLREAVRMRHAMTIGVSTATAARALHSAKRWLGWSFDQAWIEAASHTLLINCRRALTELGWRSRRTAREAIRDTC